MDEKKFDLAYKRKMLYKRKKRRKLIIKFFTIFFILFSVIVIINIVMSNNNKPFVAFNLAMPKVQEETPFVICIDPGHGDWDYGAISTNGYAEKDIVLSISLKLGKLLEDEGNFKVIYTRATDSMPWIETANDSLKERIKISKISKANLFISIHCNYSSESSEAKGIETWYNTKDNTSLLFSQYLQQNLASLSYTTNRGIKSYVKGEELAVLDKNTSTSSLVELGFLTNLDDEKYLTSNIGQDNCAKALFNGIIEYKNSLDDE